MLQRENNIRFKVLRNGADYAFLRADGAPSLRASGNAEIKMSLQGTFKPDAVDAAGQTVPVDWLSDEIKPLLVLDGVTHPLGVFAASKAPETDDDGRRLLNVQAYDRCWRVKETRAESLVYWPAGTNYITAVEQLLTGAGINSVLATPTAAVFATAREDWEIGESYLTIANQLLAEINYKQLWFNSDGVAVLEPMSVPRAESIQHVLTDFKPRRIEQLIGPAVTKTTDLYNAPNVWICVCENPDFPAPLVATSENRNVNSPLSTARRGRRIVQKVKVDNIANIDELQKYADRLRDQSLISSENVEIETALLPGFGVDAVVGLQVGDIMSVCIDREWSMSLTVGGTMAHKMERVIFNIE